MIKLLQFDIEIALQTRKYFQNKDFLSICKNSTDRQDWFSKENLKIKLFQTYYAYYVTDLQQLENSQNQIQSILRKQNIQVLKNHQRQINQQYMIYENVFDKAFVYTQKNNINIYNKKSKGNHSF
ncbi:unnamed protein product [Paramecium sonneborni]|uniref:Uncharacterized protein n=1 Tax=Paramecium sonneborni TaxID=65129 RepID=A0A8S1NLL4_9CILI|nr:unnamed protein product [Paramecium sonneborni]